MGGLGSGEWTRYDRAITVEECHRLDVRELHRGGALHSAQPHSYRWRLDRDPSQITGAALTRADGDTLTVVWLPLSKTSGERPIRSTIPIVWTACHYGGRRPWFLCPGIGGRGCGRRVAVLLSPPGWGRFVCRQCAGATYATQQMSTVNRMRRKARNLRRRLGGTGFVLEGYPPKPRGQHWRTYDRIVRDLYAADSTALVLSAWRHEALMARTDALLADRFARLGLHFDGARPRTPAS